MGDSTRYLNQPNQSNNIYQNQNDTRLLPSESQNCGSGGGNSSSGCNNVPINGNGVNGMGGSGCTNGNNCKDKLANFGYILNIQVHFKSIFFC